MKIGFQYIPMIIAGAAAVYWGLPAAHRLKQPYDIAAALAALLGVIIFIGGVLLTCLPHFFR